MCGTWMRARRISLPNQRPRPGEIEEREKREEVEVGEVVEVGKVKGTVGREERPGRDG